MIPSTRNRTSAESRRRGFTLIELMIVVAIMGILSTLAAPYYARFNARARRTEALMVLDRLDSYFVNQYENAGTFGSSLSSNFNPDPASAQLGQSAIWDVNLAGWQGTPVLFDGGLKMRYAYSTSADGSSMTITAEGNIPGLGPPIPESSLGGNYVYVTTLIGPTITTVEIPEL